MIETSFQDNIRQQGYQIFKNGLIRRLSPTNFVAKAQSADAWQLIELKNGRWVCDCKSSEEHCLHLYAALLQRSTSKLQPEIPDQANPKCRYCASPDIRGCGLRYNSHNVMRRYFCNDCGRKFSLRYVEKSSEHFELEWLLNEIGMLTTKLTELLTETNERIEALTAGQTSSSSRLVRESG